MKICAITMVYRDYWALSQWYAHYSRHLGSDNLFVVAHGHDPKVTELCPRANVITIPRDTLASFDRMRGHLLNSIQDGLGVAYDWVIRTDADELICLDPAYYDGFHTLFRDHNRLQSLFALGLNLVEDAADIELSGTDAVLTRRQHAVFSGHYSKAWAVKRGTHMVRHGIVLTNDATFTLPHGVYMAHLKYANINAMTDANVHRTEIASGSEKGLPGKAWGEAEKDGQRFYKALENMSVVEWNTAKDTAYRMIAETPVKDAKEKALRSKSVTFDTRTILPNWFKYI